MAGGSDPIWLGAEPIRFNTSPQEGDWLEASTTTVGPSSYGIYLRADVGTLVTPGILLSTDGYLKLDSSHVIVGTDSEIEVRATQVTIGTNGATYPRQIIMQLANTTLTPQGSVFEIQGADGSSILEVRDDNTFHIKTGATWVADL